MSGQPKFTVGQEVVVTSQYSREPRLAKVVKVGRTLVHVEAQWGGRKPDVFRMDTGKINDQWGRQTVYTVEEFEERARRIEAQQRASNAGLRFEHGLLRTLTPADLHALADIVEQAEARTRQ
jgi:hypothetical protein